MIQLLFQLLKVLKSMKIRNYTKLMSKIMIVKNLTLDFSLKHMTKELKVKSQKLKSSITAILTFRS